MLGRRPTPGRRHCCRPGARRIKRQRSPLGPLGTFFS
jgi:hypothetical protein